jgi:hypothetical protein
MIRTYPLRPPRHLVRRAGTAVPAVGTVTAAARRTRCLRVGEDHERVVVALADIDPAGAERRGSRIRP